VGSSWSPARLWAEWAPAGLALGPVAVSSGLTGRGVWLTCSSMSADVQDLTHMYITALKILKPPPALLKFIEI